MSKRNPFLVSITAVVALSLAGCVVQRYRNPDACRQMMHERLAQVSHARLSITHTAVSYQGLRVVVEGRLRSTAPTVSATSSPALASEVNKDGDVSRAADADMNAEGADAADTTGTDTDTTDDSLDTVLAANATARPKVPTTLVGSLLARFPASRNKPHTLATAAECTFSKSGMTSFRWLAPAQLARTTPDPDAQDDDQKPDSNAYRPQ